MMTEAEVRWWLVEAAAGVYHVLMSATGTFLLCPYVNAYYDKSVLQIN